VRYLLRSVGWLAGAIALVVTFGAIAGRLGIVFGVGTALVATLWQWLWLPRSAHAAFELGRYASARRRYRVLGALAVRRGRERSAVLSRAGCYIAAGELEHAERLLAQVPADELDAAERAVWLNNRACVALAAGTDPHAALALVDEASALRPDVASVQHTRGMALLAVGRVDDAIAVLDGMRGAGQLSPRLEAERCRELARAWTQKGEAAYADDYRLRAEALAR
jgi:predicted Zn-dependent protease